MLITTERDRNNGAIRGMTISDVEEKTSQTESTPRRIRTSDRRIRSPMLYPAELWARDRKLPVESNRLRSLKRLGTTVDVVPKMAARRHVNQQL